jgi:predicted nucleic acid-binding protein
VTRILLDVNLVLDVLLDRKPHAAAASDVWAAVETGRAEGFLSAHAITTVHYLNAKAVGWRTAIETTDALLSVFEVAPVDESVTRSALALGWPDFEDAVTAAAAERARCAAIVTRNPRDFHGSPVRVLTPVEAAAWLGCGGQLGVEDLTGASG